MSKGLLTFEKQVLFFLDETLAEQAAIKKNTTVIKRVRIANTGLTETR